MASPVSSLGIVLLLLSLQVPSQTVRVTVASLGTLLGSTFDPTEMGLNSREVAVFKGIPYAAAPVGDLRWRSPQPLSSFRGTPDRDATSYGDSCVQRWGGGDEDCLYLNIATPLAAIGAAEKLPVIVWIHGGAYMAGAGADTPVEIGATLANDSIVQVTMNYRLGVFGFMGSRHLAGRSTTGAGAFGNYGIEDQRLALKWIKTNIAHFGGDPLRVTIAGQSAGGGAVLNHLVQKESFGLYSRAAAWSAWPYAVPSVHAERQYTTVLKSTNCDTLSCLTNLPASAFNLNAINEMSFGPVVDGVAQTDSADEMIRQGQANLVPTIITNVKDEAATDFDHIVCIDRTYNCTVPSVNQLQSFVRKVLTNALVTESEKNCMPALLPFRNRVGPALLSCMAASIASLYSTEADAWTRAAHIQADVPIWGLKGPCSTRRRAQWIQASGMKSVFAAQFAYDTSLMYTGTSIDGLVTHGDDMRVLYDFPPDAVATFASVYWGYFVQFAKTGDPNGGSVATTPWPAFNERNVRLVVQGPKNRDDGQPILSVASDFLRDRCDYWDSVYSLVTSNTAPSSFSACALNTANGRPFPTMGGANKVNDGMMMATAATLTSSIFGAAATKSLFSFLFSQAQDQSPL
jgi:para-nitrobenzyl esterase